MIKGKSLFNFNGNLAFNVSARCSINNLLGKLVAIFARFIGWMKGVAFNVLVGNYVML